MANPNPKGKTYLLKGIPADIYEAAQKKAAENRPPLSMRWVLITLLEKWAGHRPPSADAPPRVFKPRTKKPKAPKAPMVDPLPTTDDSVVGSRPVEQPDQLGLNDLHGGLSDDSF